MLNAPPIATIKLFDQVNLGVLLTLYAICIIICVAGAIRSCKGSTPQLPVQELTFPTLPDFAIALMILTALIANNIGAILLPAPTEPDPNPWISTLYSSLIFLPVILRLIFLPKTQGTKLGFKSSFKYIALGIIGTWITAALAETSGLNNFFINTIGSPEEQDAITILSESSWTEVLPLIVMAVLIAPIVEECLFRGMIYPCLRRFIGIPAAMLLCGLLFGAIHMALPQLLPLSALGCYLCYLYEKAQSLWLPILTHIVFNSITVTLILVVLPFLAELGYELEDKL